MGEIIVGFEDFKGLSEGELYVALIRLAKMRTDNFGFTESGKQIHKLAEGLALKIITKEDIVGSEAEEGLLSDFAEEIKDDGVSPEIINKVLVDKFGVGKKYITEPDQFGLMKGKYVDDNEPQDWEGYIRKPKEEVEPEVKEDFTEKILMAKIQEKNSNLDKKYPELFGKDKKIDDAIALREKLEQEKKELEKLKEKEDDAFDGLTKDDFFKILGDLVKAIEKNEEIVDDFVKDPKLSQYKGDKDKVFMGIQQFIYDCINDKGE